MQPFQDPRTKAAYAVGEEWAVGGGDDAVGVGAGDAVDDAG